MCANCENTTHRPGASAESLSSVAVTLKAGAPLLLGVAPPSALTPLAANLLPSLGVVGTTSMRQRSVRNSPAEFVPPSPLNR